MSYQISSRYLNENFNPQDITDTQPWKHFILDNLLDDDSFQKLQQQLMKTNHEFRIGQEDPEQIQYRSLPDIELAKVLLSKRFKNLLEKISGHQLEIYQQGAVQLRRMTPDSPEFPPHVDFVDHRTLVMLYYLSPHWSSAKSGELLLLKEENTDPQSKDAKWIAPLENRMVLFFCDDENWHSVRKVIDWERFLIFAEWSVLN